MKKKFIWRLLPWLIVLAALVALVVFVGIPLFTPEVPRDIPAPEVAYYEGDETPLILENDALLFEMDPTTTHFKVTEKATGREWLSNPADADSDPIAKAANKEMLMSTLSLTHATAAGIADMNNYKYSIENGTYSIEVQEDGAIRVNYAIGKIEKIYMIPTAITKERFDVFKAEMKKSTQKKLTSNYTLYEPEKLDSKKNKDEIIAMYPEVLNQALYILKSDTSENNKAKIEGYWAEVGYTADDYAIDQQLVAGAKDNSGAVFNVSMVYRLDGSDLVLEIPYDSIRYKEEYPITFVTPLPMFGAAGTEDEGFMFVPEGGGALINFNNGKLNQNSYYANMYGWDYATRRNEVINETRNTFPVFGMAKNGGSFICIMEGATSYGGVMADISGRYNSYNWLCGKYNVLHSDQYNVSSKTAQLVFMYEQDIPDDCIVQRYKFIDSDRYVDMANVYGEYLRQHNPELAASVASEQMPVSVEMVGAIDKTMVKFGLPIDSVVATTTFEQAQQIIGELDEGGIQNLSVRYSGWANRGLTQRVLTDVKVIKQLGGEAGMKNLISFAKDHNANVYFDGVNCFAYDSGIFQGFIGFSDAARYTTREQVKIYPYDIITYLESDWLDPYYLTTPSYAKENASNLIDKLSELGAQGVAFRDIGYMLSADYNPKKLVTREEAKVIHQETMKEAKAAGQNVIIRMGNDYALPYADLITDMDLNGSSYAILDRNVPFYQIALHGLKDYTGEPINLASDTVEQFLQCVEYGAGLNYTFMAEDTKILQDTLHSGFYAAHYDSWKDSAIETINRYQTDMNGLNQQKIVDHEMRDSGVAVTTYEDGTKVYVNYSERLRRVDGVNIPARDYSVERGSGK
ncbi:MAG: hypothetical protein E7323_05895 [Clostridiales bacterium]|nr:hypothetical protein [Clostridiales bacterium]